MGNPDFSKRKRITAGIAALMILVVTLSASFFIAAEAGHDCEEEDCPVCECILQCEMILSRIGTGITVPAAVLVAMAFLMVCAILFTSEFRQETLVSKKIRLNN